MRQVADDRPAARAGQLVDVAQLPRRCARRRRCGSGSSIHCAHSDPIGIGRPQFLSWQSGRVKAAERESAGIAELPFELLQTFVSTGSEAMAIDGISMRNTGHLLEDNNAARGRWCGSAALMFFAAALSTVAWPQASAPSGVDLETIRSRPRVALTQAEREFVFAHWDQAFPVRVIARGPRVRALPSGAPLPMFSPGSEGARELQRSIDDFQLAGIVVLHNGKVRLERYARGRSASGRWVSFSVAKSLTSTFLGAAIKDGAVTSIDDPVTRYIPELLDSAYDGVTLRQLITMTSGVGWNEDYADPAADVARFYAAHMEPGMDATVSYMRKLRREAPPGQRWHYNTGETNLLGVVVARATGKDLATYASEKIWAPYGMEQDASWMLDRTGHEHGGCCIEASTRDFARFGQFVLDGARIDGKAAVVADGWKPPPASRPTSGSRVAATATSGGPSTTAPGMRSASTASRSMSIPGGAWSWPSTARGRRLTPVRRWRRGRRSSLRSARRSIPRRRASDGSARAAPRVRRARRSHRCLRRQWSRHGPCTPREEPLPMAPGDHLR
ncbi:MAG: serine hydrolase [Burkholderiaceae bacterium]